MFLPVFSISNLDFEEGQSFEVRRDQHTSILYTVIVYVTNITLLISTKLSIIQVDPPQVTTHNSQKFVAVTL